MERRIPMTMRQNTKSWKQVERMNPATTEDIHDLILRCEGNLKLQVCGNIIRVLANTGLRVEELKSLRFTDIDPSGEWLNIARPRSKGVGTRVVPIFSRTHLALLELHGMNPHSAFILGDCPRTRIEQTIRILKRLVPQFGRTRLWSYSVRMNFMCRLHLAGVAAGILKYLIGHESLNEALNLPSLTRDQKLQVVRRTIERFLNEL
jgi:integrase